MSSTQNPNTSEDYQPHNPSSVNSFNIWFGDIPASYPSTPQTPPPTYQSPPSYHVSAATTPAPGSDFGTPMRPRSRPRMSQFEIASVPQARWRCPRLNMCDSVPTMVFSVLLFSFLITLVVLWVLAATQKS